MLGGFQNTARRAALLALISFTMVGAALAGTVTISSPGSGASVKSPLHLVASASSSNPISGISVYVNGSKVKSTSSSKIDTYISTSTGSKRITVQGFTSGGSFSKTIYVNVTGTTSSSTTSTYVSSSAKTYYNIEQMSGWDSCTVCAGKDGAGDVAKYSMTRGQRSPSMDGNSTRFWLGGSNNYTNALWWKQLGGNSSARNFVYDLYFYMKNPSASQALEFDVNQSVGGRKYIFGTECNIKGTGTWRVWAADRSWINTGIPCGRPAAYKWHRLVWEFARTSDNKVKFISVTLNGRKHYVNRVYSPKSSGVSEINVAFQMDGDKYQTDHDVWLDKVKLSYW